MRDKEVMKKAFIAGVDFHKLTDEEIEIAYEAYQQRMCDLGNLMIVAIRKAAVPDSEPFVFEEEHTRAETFSKFGLED